MNFIKISLPYSELLANDSIKNLAIASIMLGAKVQDTDKGITTYTNVKNDSTTYNMLTLDTVAYIVSLNGEVYNYQTFIEIDLNTLVPTSIRNSTIIIDEIETRLKWIDWIDSNAGYTTIDNKTYISSYANYSGFKSTEKPDKCLTGSEITILRTNGYNVLNKNEFITLKELNNE